MKTKSGETHVRKMAWTVMVTVFASFFLYMLGRGAIWFSTSVVSIPEHRPFDGTVYPIKKVPNWVKISSDKYKQNYNSFSNSELINLPMYIPSKLKTDADSLQWGNPGDDLVRNMKITYPVPYMGNYNLDGLEHAGSHPAIDIKIPEGTPIYAMANGTVIKASTQSDGFGHHIVLIHRNFPTLNSKNKKTTLYSSYSHLGDVLVKEGDVVRKGDQIARSGMTGTATTPHLHFQLDNEESDWHPYWPFTWSEVSAAGLNFFTAVNAGLGRENAEKATINPLEYVQKYLDSSSSGSYVDEDDDEKNRDDEKDDDRDRDEEDEDDEEDTKSYVDSNDNNSSQDEDENEDEDDAEIVDGIRIEIPVKSTYYVGGASEFQIYLKDEDGQMYRKKLDDDIKVTSRNGNFKPMKKSISGSGFSGGIATNSMNDMKAGTDRIEVEYKGETFRSTTFTIIDNKADGRVFSDVETNSRYYTAVSYLAEKNVIAGYPDGTFKPDRTVSRVEAIKLILEGTKENLHNGDLPFRDTGNSEWYTAYLYTAYQNKIIDGYPDGSFKPGNTVNRAEFYKILLNGMDIDVNMDITDTMFDDVYVSDWFAPYLAHAKKLGIIGGAVRKINPSEGMSRGEVAEAIYRVMTVI